MQSAASIAAPTRVAHPTQARYARCIEISKRVRWEIERDVIRDRRFDPRDSFLPVGLTFVDRLDFLGSADRRFVSQIQGRTYANMFSLVERYVTVKILDLARAHGVAEPVALEALVRFGDEEIKHQALFERLEGLCAKAMPPGYAFVPDAEEVAAFVLGKSDWAVIAQTCMIELVTQAHYRESIGEDAGAAPLFRDAFLFHWKEESQHAVLDELEWLREDARLMPEERDAAVDDLIALVGGVDGLLQAQARSDCDYFLAAKPQAGMLSAAQAARLHDTLLAAYRWQYIVSGARQPHFAAMLEKLVTPEQHRRIAAALAPLAA